MVYRFGVYEFDDDSGELRKNGRVAAIEPQPAKALALLLARAADRGDARADDIVTREELRDALWGSETHVDFDRGLAYCISQVRAALGDSGDNPRFVQTLPKRGFRFVAPVAAIPPAADAAAARTFNSWVTIPLTLAMAAVAIGMMVEMFSSPPPPQRTVLAVSVFDNETGQPEFDRPVAGLTDLVVERLTKLDPDRMAVIGNAAVLRQPRNIRNLKAVASAIKADYVLLGQLQRGETGLRFITHFIRLRDEAHLKANRLAVADEKLGGLEAAVVEEFERAAREHVLTRRAN
jgi:DNA-binding winged helix-turn-helix (wHTH) protein/TolB-like protein